MVALLMVGLMGIAAYSAWDPDRNTSAAEHFNEKVAERGAILFARNCRLCHGDMGEGGALGGRLAAAPALNRPSLQGFVDIDVTLTSNVDASADTIQVNNSQRLLGGSTILVEDERMKVKSASGNTVRVERGIDRTEASAHASGADVMFLDPAVLEEQIDLVTNTITCGRVGTAMPAWAQSQGGPLSDEQIRQLRVLITEGWWELVAHEVAIEDAIDAELTRDVDESTISLPVSDVTQFNEDEAIRIGEERLRVTGVPTVPANDPDKGGILSVERGILGSVPLPHAVDEEIFKFPEPAEPAILQQSCGQTARPAAPSAPPSEKACAEPCQTVNLVGQNILFDKDEIAVTSGGNVRIHFENKDTGVQHNVAVYVSSSNLTAAAPNSIGTIFGGPGIDDVVFATPAVGSYFFRCDVHPTTMTGDFIVR
jgi:mono/diheme cytochrome c family protein